MSRKDYVLIAESLRYARCSDTDARTIDHVAECLARALATDNPRFNADRFLTAAGHSCK
jgi:hypothetical protein